MKTKSFLVITIIVCMASACSHKHRHTNEAPIIEKFETQITPSGLKLFKYSVSMASPDERTSDRGKTGKGRRAERERNHASGDKPNGSEMKNRFKERIEKHLFDKLTDTGYCREGYLELGSSIARENPLSEENVKKVLPKRIARFFSPRLSTAPFKVLNNH